jgi:tRNA-splicing ligase RtcB
MSLFYFMKSYIYAENLDEAVLKQFENCVKQPYVIASALMPDAHLGYAAPIGAVLITQDYIVPAWVGFDIGCGMCAFKLSGISVEQVKKHAKEIHAAVNKVVPMGVGQKNEKSKLTSETINALNELISKYKAAQHNEQMFNFFKSASFVHAGTLGGGNHFIELGTSGKDVWLIIHVGSRGVGHRIATHYMSEAAKLSGEKNIETTCSLKADSDLGKEYLAVLDILLDYALLNRLEIGRKAVLAIESVLHKKIKAVLWTNKNHNHVVIEKGLFVHRKGATPAKKGERGVIPGNMRDGSVLVIGKGSAAFLNSSSHGAGRIMSRRAAKERINLDEFKREMSGIVATVNEHTLNEAPGVYKNLDSVLELQKESIKVVKVIKPLINWKGSESKFRD